MSLSEHPQLISVCVCWSFCVNVCVLVCACAFVAVYVCVQCTVVCEDESIGASATDVCLTCLFVFMCLYNVCNVCSAQLCERMSLSGHRKPMCV